MPSVVDRAEAKRIYMREWEAKNRERRNAYAREWEAKNRERRNAYAREWNAKNPDKVKAKKRREYIKHASSVKARAAAWIAANPERAKATRAAYNKANEEKLRAYRVSRSEERKAAKDAWHAANPLARRIYQARRRAAKGSHSKDDVARLLDLQRAKCAACRCDISHSTMEIDHVIALSNGGTNDRENIQLLCRTCNRSKRAKHPIDFMQSRGFLL